MFDISTDRDFLEKLKAEFSDFQAQPDSARLALNCVVTAFHLYERVWGSWLKTDHGTLRALGIRDKESFLRWLDEACPFFPLVQTLTNGTKHFLRDQCVRTERVSGW